LKACSTEAAETETVTIFAHGWRLITKNAKKTPSQVYSGRRKFIFVVGPFQFQKLEFLDSFGTLA